MSSKTGVIAIASRRWRLLLIALVVAVIVLSTNTASPSSRLRTAQRLLQSGQYTFQGQAILPDAHRLQDADDFLPHFKGVVQYPSLLIEQTKANCFWPNESAVNLQWDYDATRGHDMDWILEDEDNFVIDAIRKQWQYYIANELRPWSEHRHKFSGRGIVIPAGHEKSIQRAKVILGMLNRLSSSLPVEIAHWGSEITEDSKQDLLKIRSVYFNDLSKGEVKTFFGGSSNFQLKIPAILNSRFAEIVLMDSDNLPVIDPAVLFESDTYKEYGTIFWPDMVKTRPQNPIWAITNTICNMQEWEQESGQVVLDKRKFWYHLQLATWWETENKLYYGKLLLGDKDMFRFAWHALKTKFGTPSRWLTSVGTLTDGVYCGHSFAQHHPDVNGSVAFLHGGLLKTFGEEVTQWQLRNHGGIFQAYKRSPYDQDPMKTEPVRVSWDQSKYPITSEGYRPAWCTNFPDVSARPLEEVIAGFQEAYQQAGGYWILDKKAGAGVAA